MKSHIRIENLNVFYGDFQALRDISLEIPEKKITAIIGQSGCGKTTLLKCMNRLIELVDGVRLSGRILVDDIDVLNPNVEVIEVRRKIGLLSQKPNPLPLSIYDNVAYGPKIHGTRDKKLLDQVVKHYLKVAGLWEDVADRLNSPASKLSLGQQQRLCLARGLAVEPKIMLCDEPTSSLDPVSALHIEEQIARLKKDYTMVIVTHNLDQAVRLADYAIYLHSGNIVEQGAAEIVFGQAKENRTKTYINGPSIKNDSVLTR
jgi:phosphate transport system ATP-binding protein